jgi:hypothetical protein
MENKLNLLSAKSKIDDMTVRPLFFLLSNTSDKKKLDQLLNENPDINVFDELQSQVEELVKCENPKIKFSKNELTETAKKRIGKTPSEYGVWVYYPWSKKLIHILDKHEFIKVRTNRNQYKITPEEKEILSTKKIGIIGLSVGQAIALTMAMERICGELRLADFDVLELTNLNRIRSGVSNLGVSKVIMAAREILEIDPFLKVTCYPNGITEDNIDNFIFDGGKLDILLDECDGLYVKILSRQKAKDYKIPMVMEMNDRGTVDIERYDLEPNRPLLHGFIDHLEISKVKEAKTNEQKVPYLLPMLGEETISTRLKASMLEIEQTITTWPQLASSVTLGGGVCTDICRRILLGQFHDSGRYFIDLEQLISDKIKTPVETTHLEVRDSITKKDMLEIINEFNIPELKEQIELDKEIVTQLVTAATMAPSGANIQPWRWIYKNKSLYLFRDDVYTAGLLDCKNTTTITGLGAAAENLVLKAHELKLEIIVETLPDLDCKSKLIAVFRFFDKVYPQYVDQFEQHVCDELVDTIPHRLTNRNIVERKIIERSRLEKLCTLARTIKGADLMIIDDEKQMDEIGEVTARVDRMRIMHKGGHDDFHAEVRWNEEEVKKTLNGVDLLGTVDLTPTELAGWKMVKEWPVVQHLNEWKLGAGLEKIQRKNIASASALGLLTVPRFSNYDFFMGGRALERVWLAANKDNIAVHTASLSTLIFNTLLYADNPGFTKYMEKEALELRKKFEDLFSIDSNRVDVLLLRFLIAPPPKRKSVRYPIDHVLSFP